MTVALTGGIASGKSLLSKYLNQVGVETLDADDVVHQLESPGGEAASAVFSRFNTLNRAELAELCFGANPQCSVNRKDLESILFPLVRRKLIEWARNAPLSSHGYRVAVVPLLFETGWNVDYDVVACIASSRDAQLQRMIETRGMSRVAAEARLAAQMPVESKMKLSDYVIRNDGSAEELKLEARKFLAYLEERTR